MKELLEAVVWGLVQGLTEFLPISSSGHLVVVPGFLGMEAPSLETAAFLHMGTLAAVIVCYWPDLRWLLKFRSDEVARKVVGLLALGSVPAAVGYFLRDSIAALFESNKAVGVCSPVHRGRAVAFRPDPRARRGGRSLPFPAGTDDWGSPGSSSRPRDLQIWDDNYCGNGVWSLPD